MIEEERKPEQKEIRIHSQSMLYESGEMAELRYYLLAFQQARIWEARENLLLFLNLVRLFVKDSSAFSSKDRQLLVRTMGSKAKNAGRAILKPFLSDRIHFPYPTYTGDPMPRLSDVQRMQAMHNQFEGERIFLIGNGPSLNRMPLHLLKNEYTYGVNRIYLLFDRIDWRPTFYSAFDLRVVPDNKVEIDALDIDYKFFATKHRQTLAEQSNHYWYLDNSRQDGLDNRFEPTVVYTGFGGGGTIMTLTIQIAYYLGFDPIYLIGVDADYKVLPTVKQDGPDKFGDGVLLNLESTQDDDPNHFDPRYFGKGKKWHNPNVSMMVQGFGDCRAGIEKRGRHLYNATVGGKLEVLERVDFESLF